MPRLVDIMWEDASIVDGYFRAVYLGAGDYRIGFMIPDADWVDSELREVLEDILD